MGLLEGVALDSGCGQCGGSDRNMGELVQFAAVYCRCSADAFLLDPERQKDPDCDLVCFKPRMADL